jgi:hypothetical protein
MKWCALLLLAAGLGFEDKASSRFTGIVHDNQCVGPNCATQCPIVKGPKYTLQSGEGAWILSDQTTPARYVGKKVIVRGTVEPENRLKIISITAAEE